MDKISLKNDKIKIAVIGCGRISIKHFESINFHNSDFLLVAVCDINKEIADEVGKKYDVPSYTSIEDMLINHKLDICSLCTPSGMHSSQTITLANNKINVITEKPMATNWIDGLNMVESCNKNNVKLFVVKQNRFNSTLQELKQAIQEKRFGKFYLVQLNVFWSRPQSYYDSADWRGKRETDGGALMNQASHYVDLAEWLIGPVAEVQAMISTLARNIEVEDTGVVNIKWCNGALGSVAVTMLTYPKNYEGSITVIGEYGTVSIGGEALNEIIHWEFKEKTSQDDLVYDSNYESKSVYGNGHLKYFKNIVDVFKGEAISAVDGLEGLKSLELLIAIYKSAEENKTISLPIERNLIDDN